MNSTRSGARWSTLAAAGLLWLPQRLRCRRAAPASPLFLHGRDDHGYLGGVGIRLKMRLMERAAYTSALLAKKLRGVCVCATALYGNAASRMSELVPSAGA
jgi:hypothetical protein